MLYFSWLGNRSAAIGEGGDSPDVDGNNANVTFVHKFDVFMSDIYLRYSQAFMFIYYSTFYFRKS